jgi:hypothetical protein
VEVSPAAFSLQQGKKQGFFFEIWRISLFLPKSAVFSSEAGN